MNDLSPSEAYAQFRAGQARERTALGTFRSRFSFDLDPFQIDACEALEAGQSVLVAAPTGAGKTVVGEFAVHLALASGRKVFYTAPMKALSNQKFGELVDWLGADRVGLLTGDTSIRPEADVVVMTTEVLRNMLYADSDLLAGLGFVVMDEVHYLADCLRGPVWEEVIIHLDPQVRLVALSATVSNAEEFGAWVQEVRGDTTVVVSETRPVPLWQHVVVGDQILDLFVDADGEAVVSHGPGSYAQPIVNPDIQRTLSLSLRIPQGPSSGGRGGEDREFGGRGGRGRGHGRGRGKRDHRGRGRGRHGRGAARHHEGADGRNTASEGRRGPGDRGFRGGGGLRPPRQADLVRMLEREALLPAIFFIFSRSGCEAAVRRLSQSHLRLTSEQERRRIARILDERLQSIGIEDEWVLGIDAFRRAALDGYAAHHAGIIPLLKTIVEELFAEGLIKAVFATETLALGINMPARSVVLDKLVKFNGVEHADLTAGEYTQLTGRAGRRGIDTEGHAVVVADSRFDAQQVASLASKRTYPLRSAFRPTANMTVNLLERFDRDQARRTLEQSFAQFQADRSVVGLARRVRDLERTAADYREAMHCERGNLEEYAELQAAVTEREKQLSRQRAEHDRVRTRTVLRRLQRGDVLAMPGGRRNGYGVVLEVNREALGGPVVEVLGQDGRRRMISAVDLPSSPAVIDSMKLPRQDRMGTAKVRRDTAAALRQRLAGHDADPRKEVRRRTERAPSTAATDHRLQELREQIAAHPCADCPDLTAHLRWIGRWRGTQKELEGVHRRIEGRTSTLARQFDRLCTLLVDLGYLCEEGEQDLRPTEAGLRLRRLFSERDLLIAECLEHGAWEGLDPSGLAAVVSAAVHEGRRDDGSVAAMPEDSRVLDALEASARIGRRLTSAETAHGIEPTTPPDPGVCLMVHRWARGKHLAAALDGSTLTPGDFVRHCRQVIDMLDQLVSDPAVGAAARAAVPMVRRGLVAQEISR